MFEIGYTHWDSEWGIHEIYHGGKDGMSYVWDPAIIKREDLEKIQTPKIEVNYRTTLQTVALASEVFGTCCA